MDKISIVIPIYNVEPYIRKCLDSILNQTYSNLEILLINDGSTDKSGIICDEYAKTDNRIKVFHQTNQGVSAAKNVGLSHLTGQYIGFIDPDDWIEPDMYETLYKAINESNVSVSVCGYYNDTGTESIHITNRTIIPNGIIQMKEMLLYPLQRDYYMAFCGYLWNKLFKADGMNRLLFDTSTKYGEDVLFYIHSVLSGYSTGTYVNKPLYHYYQRDSGISKSKSFTTKTDILSVYKKIEQLLDSNGYTDISYWARGFYCHHAGVIAEIAVANGDMNMLSRMQDNIKAHINDYIKTNKEFPHKFERMYSLLNI